MTSELSEFLTFIAPMTTEKRYSKVFYYPEKSLKRIKNDQMTIFIDECIKAGLIAKDSVGIHMTEHGKSVVASKSISMLSEPYRKALKRINKLYIDILI
jgi:hypothetical protein